VIDIRAIGFMAGIELEPRPGAPGVRAYEIFVDCFERGLLVRATGDTLALSPPLIAQPDQFAVIVDMLSDALRRAA
jgi:beta-alanine--pyruvate transaminase